MEDKLIVGFSKPKTWKPFAWLIMKGYSIPYDHVYVSFHSESLNRDVVFQASGLSVNFMGKVFFDENDVLDEFELSISEENKKKLLQFALDNAGNPYGIKIALGLALVRIASLFGKKIKNPFGGEFVCSTLVGHILKKFEGIDIPDSRDNINPKEVYDYMCGLEAKGKIKRII